MQGVYGRPEDDHEKRKRVEKASLKRPGSDLHRIFSSEFDKDEVHDAVVVEDWVSTNERGDTCWWYAPSRWN